MTKVINYLELSRKLIRLVDSHLLSIKKVVEENDGALLAIMRRSLTTFKILLKLIQLDYAGSSSLVIARTLLETMVSVMYMELKGLSKMLQRFRKFVTAEAMQDINFFREKGIDVSDLNPDKIQADYVANRDIFERKPGEVWQSWAHTSFEGMVNELLKSGKFQRENIKTILSSYLQACRKTHLSPTDAKFYFLGAQALSTMSNKDARLALLVGMTSLIQTAKIFAKHFNDDKLITELDSIFGKIDV